MLAIPIAPEVVGLIDPARPGAHEQTATLINVGRGALVDIPALKQSLQERAPTSLLYGCAADRALAGR